MSTKRVEEGHIKGIKLAMRSPVLSHLFFADDSIFFVQAEERNCTRLKRSGSWNLDSVASYLNWKQKDESFQYQWGPQGTMIELSGPGLLMDWSTIDPAMVIENVLRAQMEFTEIRRVPSDEVAVNNILNVNPASWNAPSGDFVKINVDEGWIGDTLNGGIGVVIRNTDGLALSANLGFRDVIVETDSKLLINGINGDFRNKVWSIMPLLEELHRIYGSMHEVRWSWVHRDLNRAAHEAVMIGVRAMVEVESWVSRPPLSLVQVMVSDGLPCPP
ncbi:hypothetical protein L3X38_038895 [Prunus dulcis]|uniref:RNase H type-1 domain-containing protein n=1 Tax=Prunus dulcis TaxID=3755 RepID=A0AAD4V880_PRUDU|nr:hypothetical protein L3X38_038895 [Prunus dulcis]